MYKNFWFGSGSFLSIPRSDLTRTYGRCMKPLYTAGTNVNSSIHYGNQYEVISEDYLHCIIVPLSIRNSTLFPLRRLERDDWHKVDFILPRKLKMGNSGWHGRFRNPISSGSSYLLATFGLPSSITSDASESHMHSRELVRERKTNPWALSLKNTHGRNLPNFPMNISQLGVIRLGQESLDFTLLCLAGFVRKISNHGKAHSLFSTYLLHMNMGGEKYMTKIANTRSHWIQFQWEKQKQSETP